MAGSASMEVKAGVLGGMIGWGGSVWQGEGCRLLGLENVGAEDVVP